MDPTQHYAEPGFNTTDTTKADTDKADPKTANTADAEAQTAPDH